MIYYVFEKKTGKILFELEKMYELWLVHNYNSKLHKKYLTDSEVEKLKKNDRYLFNEAVRFNNTVR